LRRTFDIVRFFNTGGELAYKEDLEAKDLTHTPSHKEKVSFLRIQDIHIEKMNESEVKKLSG